MRLYLVRHPQPLITPGICYGRTDLTVDPVMQAHILQLLLTALPSNIPLFTSPLRRCADLATTLCDTIGSAPVTMDDRLMEMHFGSWEMRAWDDIAREEIDAWADD